MQPQGYYKWQSSVFGMINDLKLHPLPARRKLIRLLTFDKIKHGIIDLKLEDHMNPAQAPRGIATHPDNYCIYRTALQLHSPTPSSIEQQQIGMHCQLIYKGCNILTHL